MLVISVLSELAEAIRSAKACRGLLKSSRDKAPDPRKNRLQCSRVTRADSSVRVLFQFRHNDIQCALNGIQQIVGTVRLGFQFLQSGLGRIDNAQKHASIPFQNCERDLRLRSCESYSVVHCRLARKGVL